uniref:Cell wall protein n=1 Tax=Leersia perrieri TaxID=77586 RepID=A0A0D9X0F0_9ORYZ
MAKSSSALKALLVLAALVAAVSARSVPADEKKTAAPADQDVKQTETFHEGTVLIPGMGRFELGSHYVPDITGFDHSVPAAESGQFIPGADDTWVPNPGFEVPNPFHPGSASP